MTVNKVGNIKLSPVDMEARKAINFKSGDTVRVWSKIKDEKSLTKGKNKDGAVKFRLQAFEGIVLARKHGTEIGATFTVRKVASGVGVERIFPLFSPMIDRIEIIKKSRARRSKIYYVRTKAVKDVRRKMRSYVPETEDPEEKIQPERATEATTVKE